MFRQNIMTLFIVYKCRENRRLCLLVDHDVMWVHRVCSHLERAIRINSTRLHVHHSFFCEKWPFDSPVIR